MATSTTLQKIGQGLSGVFLGLTGSWLLVICFGGLLTLGVLSVFHLGVLLSLACIGFCLVLAGACLLYGASQKIPQAFDENAAGWPLEESATFLKKNNNESRLSNENLRVNRPQHRSETSGAHKRSSSYPFNH